MPKSLWLFESCVIIDWRIEERNWSVLNYSSKTRIWSHHSSSQIAQSREMRPNTEVIFDNFFQPIFNFSPSKLLFSLLPCAHFITHLAHTETAWVASSLSTTIDSACLLFMMTFSGILKREISWKMKSSKLLKKASESNNGEDMKYTKHWEIALFIVSNLSHELKLTFFTLSNRVRVPCFVLLQIA